MHLRRYRHTSEEIRTVLSASSVILCLSNPAKSLSLSLLSNGCQALGKPWLCVCGRFVGCAAQKSFWLFPFQRGSERPPERNCLLNAFPLSAPSPARSPSTCAFFRFPFFYKENSGSFDMSKSSSGSILRTPFYAFECWQMLKVFLFVIDLFLLLCAALGLPLF